MVSSDKARFDSISEVNYFPPSGRSLRLETRSSGSRRTKNGVCLFILFHVIFNKTFCCSEISKDEEEQVTVAHTSWESKEKKKKRTTSETGVKQWLRRRRNETSALLARASWDGKPNEIDEVDKISVKPLWTRRTTMRDLLFLLCFFRVESSTFPFPSGWTYIYTCHQNLASSNDRTKRKWLRWFNISSCVFKSLPNQAGQFYMSAKLMCIVSRKDQGKLNQRNPIENKWFDWPISMNPT